MMKMRRKRRLFNKRSLIEIRIKDVLSTLDELTEELLHAETEILHMDISSLSPSPESKPPS